MAAWTGKRIAKREQEENKNICWYDKNLLLFAFPRQKKIREIGAAIQWYRAGFVTGRSMVRISLRVLKSLCNSCEQGTYIQLLYR